MKVYSAELLKDTFIRYEAEDVNIATAIPKNIRLHFADIAKEEVKREIVPRKIFEDYVSNQEYLNSTKWLAISTGFRGKNNNFFKSFLGMDIEYEDEKLVVSVVERLSKETGSDLKLVFTGSGYHLFSFQNLYSDDLSLLREHAGIIKISAECLQQKWASNIADQLLKAKEYADLKKESEEILKIVGHKEKGKYTFFDLRHLAHSILHNKIPQNGVRSAFFFRVSPKFDVQQPPYVVPSV